MMQRLVIRGDPHAGEATLHGGREAGG